MPQAGFETPTVNGNNLVVAELFTSQSCSSCPAADKILANLSENPNIITIGCHVTYWNHLNWEDTVSREFCTRRQRDYAMALKGRGRVYTPQMVVNGQHEFIGSRRGEAQQIIQAALQNTVIHPLKIRIMDNNKGEITLPALTRTGTYELWLFGLKKAFKQDIPTGENRGRSVHYVSAALAAKALEPWDGSSESRIISLPDQPEIDSWVVIAQEKGVGKIVAVGRI